VNNSIQEGEYRAKGYVGAGEPFPEAGDYQEFPKWMHHEKHEPVLVNDASQQSEAAAKGYFEPGQSDAKAVEAEKASPYFPGRKAVEYPRMENGVLIEDPASPPSGPIEYPKALTPPGGGDQVFVNTRAEESAQLAKWGVTRETNVEKTPEPPKPSPLPDKVAAPVSASPKPKKSSEERSAAMKAAWAKRKAEKAQATA